MKGFREGAIGWMMYGGCATSIVLGLATYFLAFGLAVGGVGNQLNGFLYLLVTLTIAAAIVSVVGLFYGVAASRRLDQGLRREIPDARVIARYAFDRNHVMHTDELSIEMCEGPRYYVRLDLGDGDNAEYECAAQVFWQAGEGMRGRAMVQGQWLGQFLPHFGADAVGHRAYH